MKSGLPFIVVLLFLFYQSHVASPACAQSRVIDSLAAELKKHPKNDTVLYRWYLQSGLDQITKSNTDSAFYFLDKAHSVAQRTAVSDWLAEYFHTMSVFSARRELMDSGMIYSRQGLAWSLRASDPIRLAFAYNDIGNMYIYMGYGDSAVISLLKGLSVAERQQNTRLASNISYNLSAAFDMINAFTQSREYARKSYFLATTVQDTVSMYNSLYNWATQESKLDRNDTAWVMFESSRKLAVALDCAPCLASVYNNLGEIYYKQNLFEKSLNEYNKMAATIAGLDHAESDVYLYANRGNTYTALGRFREAAADLSRAETIAKKVQANFELSQIYFFRSELAEKSGDYNQALFYWKLADSVKTHIASEKTLQETQRLEKQYKTAEKDRILAEQKAHLAERQSMIRRKDFINMGLLIGCILLGTIALLIYRNLRHRHRLSEKEKKIHEQKIHELKMEHQVSAMQSVMKGQEQERSRMARDLHDGVGGLLSGVKLSLSNMKGNVFLSEQNALAVRNVIDQLDQSIAELRRVSHNMMPEALIKFGLKEALENYCESLQQSGEFVIKLQTYGLDERLEQDAEIIVYRMVQELLANVVKHADAKEVLVQLIRENQKISVTVEDDGKGFDATHIEKQQGAGLRNIYARAGYLHGVVDVRSRPGEGTSVTIEGLLT